MKSYAIMCGMARIGTLRARDAEHAAKKWEKRYGHEKDGPGRALPTLVRKVGERAYCYPETVSGRDWLASDTGENRPATGKRFRD